MRDYQPLSFLQVFPNPYGLVTLGSSLEVAFSGGPLPWAKDPAHYYQVGFQGAMLVGVLLVFVCVGLSFFVRLYMCFCKYVCVYYSFCTRVCVSVLTKLSSNSDSGCSRSRSILTRIRGEKEKDFNERYFCSQFVSSISLHL